MNLPIQKYGKTERRKFGKINEVIDIPDLVEIQKDSYRNFIEEGIGEVFEDFSPITDYSDHFELYFLDHEFGAKPKYDEKECRNRDATYALPLRVKVRLVNKVKEEVIDQEVFMGDFPLMTENGSFIINGAERVIVSQLVRSPGAYNESEKDKSGREMFKTTVIPNRGAWLEFEQDSQGVMWVHVDRKRKICATVLLRALGFGSDVAIRDVFGDDERMINATIEKDTAHSEQDGLIELYRKLRPGEVPTDESVRQHMHNLFFDPRRYDVVKVGRYKFNKKLNIAYRLPGCIAAEDIVDPSTGELIVSKEEKITEAKAKQIQNAGINVVEVLVSDEKAGRIKHRIIGNNTVDFSALSDRNPKSFGLLPTVYYPNFKFSEEIAAACDNADVETVAEYYRDRINEAFFTAETKPSEDEKAEERKNREKRRENRIKFVAACKLFHEILRRSDPTVTAEEKKVLRPLIDRLNHRHITVDDVVAAVSTNLDLRYGIGTVDNIDHLGNRRVRCVGELLQNQLRVGIARLERLIKERMATQDPNEVTPSGLINVRPVSAVIREFFGSSQLSQFMDQTNPIAELTHKRKLSALGPGGLNRERATFDVRDVHHSHYGRLCPIETPEGQNIGLISSLATFAKVNEYGFIMSPYRRVHKEGFDEHGHPSVIRVTDEVDYLTADEEDKYIVAQANEPLNEDGTFVNERVSCRRQAEITQLPREMIDYMDVSPKQLVSVATALIPFLENDDTNRALMGSNMQRQAVPLVFPEAPRVGTGMEGKAAYDSGVLIKAKRGGEVIYASATEIRVRVNKAEAEIEGEVDTYEVQKFQRTNQDTCFNQKTIVSVGQKVEKGTVLADGPATQNGELALGRNILVGFVPWNGYNYEDAVLISERVVREDIYTSIHIKEFSIDVRETKLGPEKLTRDIPNTSERMVASLDGDGIVTIGTYVHPGQILVGKVTPKSESDTTPEFKLLNSIFGEKAKEVRDSSLKVPHGTEGTVIDIQRMKKSEKDELPPGVEETVTVLIATKRKLTQGDKMAGRHGNKGVVSRILPEEDMPYMEDGTPLDVCLNPLGVPSRMNIGQLMETQLGWAAVKLDEWYSSPVFQSASMEQIEAKMKEAGLPVTSKAVLMDGRTGVPFVNPVFCGYIYYLKLHHLVDDKMHARSTGPYSLVTQQPLGGKAQFGGQRLGEMEVWALEAYGAANTLQELLTIKSDDMIGRVKIYESIVKGEPAQNAGMPEAFNVLVQEIRGLALDMSVYDSNGRQVPLTERDEELIQKAEKGNN